jgi:hypothetical protein
VVILGMGEIPFIQKVVEARPNSSMHHFCFFTGLSIFSHALCVLYTVLACVDAHMFLLLNVRRKHIGASIVQDIRYYFRD